MNHCYFHFLVTPYLLLANIDPFFGPINDAAGFAFRLLGCLRVFQRFRRASRLQKTPRPQRKLKSVTRNWFIIGLFAYRPIYIFTPKFRLSDFRKVFGKELETTNGSKKGIPESGI